MTSDHDKTKGQLIEELAAARASQRKWRSLVENAPSFIIIADREGEIQYLNHTQLGHTLEESIGRHIYDFIDPEYHETARSCLAEVFAVGGVAHYETVAAGPHGDKAWYETCVGPIKDGSSVVAASLIATDITDKKRAEDLLRSAHAELEQRVRDRTADLKRSYEQLAQETEARRDTEQRYQLLGESASDVIWELDRSGVYTYLSPRVKDALGYEPEELIGKSPFNFMPPREAERMRSLFEEMSAAGEGAETLEVRRFHKDGRVVVHEISSVPILDTDGACRGYRGMTRDVTQRKLAEKALEQSHRELQAIYDGTPDGLLIVDIETRRFLRANHALCEMLGYSEDELLAMSVTDLHPAEDMPSLLGKFMAQAAGDTRLAEDLPVLRKDGSVFYVDINSRRLTYDDRPCMIGFFRDVTQRKKAEEARKREHETVKELLESTDRELKLIAYEIHDGIAQLLTGAMMHYQTHKRLKQHDPEEAAKACDKGHRMIAKCLEEARHLIGRVRLPLLDESGVVAAVQNLVYEMNEHSELEVELHSSVRFDRLEPVLENSIYRIVQEGLANAARHSRSDRAHVLLSQEGDSLRIEVRDWGGGFDAENVEGKTYGLGGIRERARLLGGTAAIVSRPGQGTRVVAELPLTPDQAGPQPQSGEE